MVKEFLAGNARDLLLNVVFLKIPGNFCHLGNDSTDTAPVGPDREIVIGKDGFQIQRVRFLECPFEQFTRNLKPDIVVVGIRRVMPFRNLQNVESKLRFQVRRAIIVIGHLVAILALKLGIEEGYGAVYSNSVAIIVRPGRRARTHIH